MKKKLWIVLLIVISNLFAEEAIEIKNEERAKYILQKGDILKIEVMEHPEFSKEVRVLPDGTIEYPIIGEIVVEDLTVSILKSLVKEHLKAYVPYPIVTIYISKIYGEKINILGYVNKPGSFQIYKPIDLVTAISIAGGMKNIRKVKYVKLIRKNGKVLNIKISKIWFSDNINYEEKVRIYLEAGDSLIVPPPMSFNWSMFNAFISLATLGLSIYILFK